MLLVGCSVFQPAGQTLPTANSLPPPPETLINFIVEAPANTLPEEIVYLSILDEVTGLALNAETHPMQIVAPHNTLTSTLTTRTYILTLPVVIGSVIKYRYERQSGPIRVAEHLTDGSPVRYRMYHVDGPGFAQDIISRWTDTSFRGPTGRIIGQATQADNDQPIPNLLITAGGAQTLTASDGSFRLENLPPGTHSLVAYALDGTFQTFQQGATVAADSTTPASIQLSLAQHIKATFVVSVPKGTLPVVPLRMAGNLSPLGNTFATLNGGISGLASRMPQLSTLPDGRYLLVLDLPAGADIRYKYTLGDGFWNSEHTQSGEMRLRQLVLPEHDVIINDQIESWGEGLNNTLTFDVSVPANTPSEDFVSIQFGPLFGWTEPIPMWPLGNNRWAYILYSPLNLPGNFSYRYCRNNQCGTADDILTPGLYGKGRPLQIGDQSQTLNDQVSAWLTPPDPHAPVPTPKGLLPRGQEFWRGIEFQPVFHPSWQTRLPQALQDVQQMNANWLVYSPTWSYQYSSQASSSLPILETVPGHDMLWNEALEWISQGQYNGLKIALYPTPQFLTIPGSGPLVDIPTWWEKSTRDLAWWTVWFEEYRRFALHHADLARTTGASALILGGTWLEPAMPDGFLANGQPSNVPLDAEVRWRDLMAEVRMHYNGPLLWALSTEATLHPPSFLDAVDQIYLLWDVTSNESLPSIHQEADITSWLDNIIQPFQNQVGKPLILAINAPSSPTPAVQTASYALLLRAASQRSWISGFIARQYYPPAALSDASGSVHGKPTADLLREWFAFLQER